MPPQAPTTKDRILDAAEHGFAERGYEGTSLRALTRAAGVNLAAVHYHFGSKRALYRAVFERRVGPINRERLRRLEQARSRAGGAPVALPELLDAFFGPPFQMSDRADPGFRRFLRIVARMDSGGGAGESTLGDVFGEVRRSFWPAFAEALPGLDEGTLAWRLHLLLGAMLAHFADPGRLRAVSGGRRDGHNPGEAWRAFRAFALAALGPVGVPAGGGTA